jgi:hypothetical protein
VDRKAATKFNIGPYTEAQFELWCGDHALCMHDRTELRRVTGLLARELDETLKVTAVLCLLQLAATLTLNLCVFPVPY